MMHPALLAEERALIVRHCVSGQVGLLRQVGSSPLGRSKILEFVVQRMDWLRLM